MSSEFYLIRFDLEQEELDAVFNETEIAKRFDEVMQENKELISNQISAVRKTLISLLENDDEELRARVSDEGNVTLEDIKESTKINILNMAVSKVLYNSSFDVKQNILKILNSGDKMKKILRERVNVQFLSITEWRYEEEDLNKLL